MPCDIGVAPSSGGCFGNYLIVVTYHARKRILTLADRLSRKLDTAGQQRNIAGFRH
jgi:hypothetical protein